MPTENKKRLWLTGGSIVGLSLGFLLGMAAHASSKPFLVAAAGTLAPIGTLWINALRMTVVPLVAAQLVASLVGTRGVAPVGRIGGVAFLTFVTMLVLAGVVTLTVTPAILLWLPLPPEALAALRSLPAAAPPPAQAAPSFGAWLVGLIPPNPLRAAVQDDLLGVMIFAIAFGVAVGRMAPERRAMVGELGRIVADAMMTIIGWIMWIMPIAAFALAMSMASRSGLSGAHVVIAFVILICALLLACTLLLYPIAAFAGGLPIWRFAGGILPTQLVAVSTRSSIASLPSMMDAARNRLGTRPEVSSLVLPLAVSSFKVNRTISAPFQFLFLAHVYGIDLSAPQIATFAVAALVLSFSTLGIPSGGSMMRSAPLYIAAGMPLEGYLLIEAAEVIPDIFKTLLNVTGNMTAMTLVNRWTHRAGAVASRPEPAIEGAAAGV